MHALVHDVQDFFVIWLNKNQAQHLLFACTDGFMQWIWEKIVRSKLDCVFGEASGVETQSQFLHFWPK